MTSKIGVKKIQYPNGTNSITIDSSGSAAITTANITTANVTNATATGTITTPSINGSQIGGRRNMIINGAMQVAQRGASSTSTASIDYHTVDRFNFRGQSTGVFTIAQDTDSPADFTYSTKITVTTPDTSIGGGQRYWVTSYLEGNTVSHLNFGTSSAKTVTLSFYVKSSLTGTFSGGLVNSAFNRAYAFTYTISSANTWERKTVTIPGDTSGTWLTTTSIGISVSFDLGAATNRQQSAGAWTASGSVAATGASQVIATNGATWQITGIQFEVGSQATAFEHRSFAEELALCERYFYMTYPYGATIGAASSSSFLGRFLDHTQSYGSIQVPNVNMRAAPTKVIYNTATGTTSQIRTDTQNVAAAITGTGAKGGGWIYVNAVSVGTSVSVKAHLTMDAEL